METNELDPTQVTSVDDLAALLRYLHARADRPSYRELESRTAHVAEILPGTRLKRVPLRRSTLSDVLNGLKFPRKAFLLTFVSACGIDLEADHRWEQAWDRLAVQTAHDGGVSVGQIAMGKKAAEERAQRAEEAAAQAKEIAESARAELDRLREAVRIHGGHDADPRIFAAAEATDIVAAAKSRVPEIMAMASGERDQILADAERRRDQILADAERRRDQILADAERRRDQIIAQAEIDRNHIPNSPGFGLATVRLPQLGGEVVEGTVTRWLKNEGDPIEIDEPLLEVCTDKVDTEIPALTSGVLLRIRVPTGETVPVGTVLAIIVETLNKTLAVGMTEDPESDAIDETPHKVSAATITEELKYSGHRVSVTLPWGLVSENGLTECTLTYWLKREGEHVKQDEPLFAITSDMVALELPCRWAGILRDVFVAEGEKFAATDELAVIEQQP